MEIRYEPRPGHLLVVVSGPFDLGGAVGVVDEVKRRCATAGVANVLVDFRAIGDVVSIADRYELGKIIAAARLPGRIAILVAAGQRKTATLEDTAVNRGAAVRTTDSEAEARAFLGLA